MYVHKYVWVHTYLYVGMHVGMCPCITICIYDDRYAGYYTHVCAYPRIDSCIHVYIHPYIRHAGLIMQADSVT